MKNHFGKGLMVGLAAQRAMPASDLINCCEEYKRGFLIGYSYSLAKKISNDHQAAFQAGALCRDYGLDRDIVGEFFIDVGSNQAIHYFYAGYDGHLLS
jgi:hypothetical protein